jgi:hypothetical protein
MKVEDYYYAGKPLSHTVFGWIFCIDALCAAQTRSADLNVGILFCRGSTALYEARF